MLVVRGASQPGTARSLAPPDSGIRLSPVGVPIEYDAAEVERDRLEAEARERRH
jgi:hypothetical protein